MVRIRVPEYIKDTGPELEEQEEKIGIEIPEYIEDIESEMISRGKEQMDKGEVGWDVIKYNYIRINDNQETAIEHDQSGEIYRTTDDNMSIEHIGAQFELKLKGGPTERFDNQKTVHFEVLNGQPSVEVDPNITEYDSTLEMEIPVCDPDPIYKEIEEVLTDKHDIGVFYTSTKEENDVVYYQGD